MSDPLSVAASIAGLISLTDTVFRYVFKYARAAVCAQKEIESLSAEINGLSAVLRNLHALASELEAEGQSFEPTLRVHHLTHCQKTFETIKRRLKKASDSFDNRSRLEETYCRLKWLFSSSETKDLLGDISRYKETITLATSADTMRKLQICLAKQTDQDGKIEKATAMLERVEINIKILLDGRKKLVLNYFMKPETNPQANLTQSIKLRHPTTGVWLTWSHAFTTWLETPGSRLWLNGIPGGGKTILAGAVIQEVLTRSSSDIGAAFFFCDYKNEATLMPVNILGAIASQLALQRDDAFDLLQNYYCDLHPAQALNQVPDVDELRATITKMCTLFKQVIVVIDGLDECGDNTYSVLESMTELAASTTNTTTALFSRDEWNIRTSLQGEFKEISIEAHKEDIELFVRAEMERRIQNGRLELNNMKLKDEIAEELITRANGMFRWVVCQLDYLCEFATDADRRSALKELPPTLPDSYRRLLERLNKRPVRVQRMVQMCLQFIAFFPSKLSTKALCQAVSTPTRRLDESNTVSERDVILGCSSLVRKSPDGLSLEFAHFSVLEFLEDELLSTTPGLEAYRLSRPISHKSMAIQSIKFIKLQNCETLDWTTAEVDDIEEEHRRNSYPFYQEAPLVKELFHAFISQPHGSWAGVLLSTIIEVAGRQDAHKFVSWAHHQDTKSVLIDGNGANVNSESSLGPPLLLAQISFLGLLSTLLGFPSQQSTFFKDFLPSSGRRNRTIACLVEAGASFEDLTKYTQTHSIFLATCIIGCHVKAFQPAMKLLDKGIIPEDTDFDAFQEYLETWVHCDDSSELQQPLLAFLRHLRESLAYKCDWGLKLGKVLWSVSLKMGLPFTSDPTLTDSRISLSEDALLERVVVAVSNDDADALQSYLDDERINVQDSYTCNGYYGNLLCFSLRSNSVACIERLLFLGSDPDSKDVNGLAALHHCLRSGDGETLQVLARFNAFLLAEDGDGCNLWHYCAKDLDFAVPFLDVLFNLNKEATHTALLKKNSEDQAPLVAVLSHTEFDTEEERNRHEFRALMFLDYCNQASQFWLKHDSVFPAVYKFASTRVFKKLIEFGLTPDAWQPSQATPLHELGPATSSEWVDVLVSGHPGACNTRFGGRLPIEDYLKTTIGDGTTPNEAVIKSLVSTEILKSKDDQGSTPWEFACNLSNSFDGSESLRTGFLMSGWRPMSAALAILLKLKAMDAYEAEVNQCGVYPLFSALVCTSNWFWMATKLISANTLDEAILSSQFWDPKKDDGSVRFLKRAILEQEESIVTVLLKHSVNVHRRVDGTSAIEYACEPSIALQLSGYDNDFGQDRKAQSLLHRIASPSDNPGLEWLVRQLVGKGLDINAIHMELNGLNFSMTPLVHHLDVGSFYCAELLLDMGANPSPSGPVDAQFKATHRGSVSFLRKLLAYSRKNSVQIDWRRKIYIALPPDRPGISGANNLHFACFEGHLECVKFYLDEGILEIDTVTDRNLTPLHCAAVSNRIAVIEHLISEGADINATTALGYTPLSTASAEGNLAAARTLVRLGALNLVDSGGMTARMRAFAAGHNDVVQFLDEAFAGLGNSNRQARGLLQMSRAQLRRLGNAIDADNMVDCKDLLAQGCPLDAAIPGRYGCSPLSYALAQGRAELAQLFLDNGASTLGRVTFSYSSGWSTIHYASSQTRLVSVLSSVLRHYLHDGGDWAYGIDFPLHNAVYFNNQEALKLMLNHLVENSDKIAYVSQLPRDKIVSKVVNRMFVIPIPGSKNGEQVATTALHVAASTGNIAAARLLLQHGANIDSIDARDARPLDYASNTDMATFLLKSGASTVAIFTETVPDLLRRWQSGFVDLLRVHQAEGLQGLGLEAANVMNFEDSVCYYESEPTFNINSLLELEKMGINWTQLRYGHFTLANTFLRVLEELGPFTWHQTIRWGSKIPPLGSMFRHFQRRLGRDAFARWMNLHPEDAWSPLCRAASQDMTKTMENCLALGAEIDFEGCPLGSALMIASACGSLDSVKFLVRRGAKTSYFGRRGPINAFSIARSCTVKRWLLVERFREQPSITASEDAASHSPAQTVPWSGIAQARMKLVSLNSRAVGESTLQYAAKLGRIKRDMRGRIAIVIDGLLYPHHTNRPDQTTRTGSIRIENMAEQIPNGEIKVGATMDDCYRSVCNPLRKTPTLNMSRDEAPALAEGLYRQPGKLGFIVTIHNDTNTKIAR
ncbi:hypothetical protein FDECE_14196 [Fusarium decemcellulare]|nr:hypothetical protein FDECE_14196 [Fusarium decemcellulare]